MRNLKRVLSLALALVMVLGMMVITTSAADFGDADEITNTEAVEVLAAIGIVGGDNTGNFNPNGTFTREAAAKLLTYMKLGPDMAEKLAGTDVFTDVKATRWSAKYIGYCANLGYITGVGDGKFNPTGILTDIELGKLVLCALGYDAAKYTGANWATAVTVDMLDAGLVNTVTGTAISREDACAMILAGMNKGNKVTTYNVKDGEKTVKFDSQNDALLYCAIKAGASFEGKVTVTENSLLKTVYGVTYADGYDAYGRPATTYTDVDGLNLAYADEALATYVNTFNKKTAEDLTKLGYKFAVGTVTYNGGTDATLNEYSDLYMANGQAINGYTVELYADKDKNITDIIVIEQYLATVGKTTPAKGDNAASLKLTVAEAAAGTVEMTITDNVKKDNDLFDVLSAYAEKDKVIVTCKPGWDTEKTAASILAVEAPSSVAGVITKVTAGGKNCTTTIVIDGTTYKLNNECVGGSALTAGTEGTLYLDAQGNGIGWAGKKAPDAKYAYVLKADTQDGLFDTDAYYAQLLYTNGTVEVVETDKLYTANTLVNYKTNDEGKVELSNAKTAVEASVKLVNNDATQIGCIWNNKTVIVIETTNPVTKKPVYTAYTGITSIPNVKSTTKVVSVVDSGIVEIYYAMGAELDTTPTTSKNVVYLGNASDKVEELAADGKTVLTYYTYNAIVNGEITTIDATVNTLGGKMYGELTLDKNDLVTAGTAVSGKDIATFADEKVTSAAKDGVINGYIYDDATAVYEVAKNGTITVSSIDAIEVDDYITGYTTNGILTMVVFTEVNPT